MAGSCAARATVRDDSSAATPRTDTDFTAAAQPGPCVSGRRRRGAGERQHARRRREHGDVHDQVPAPGVHSAIDPRRPASQRRDARLRPRRVGELPEGARDERSLVRCSEGDEDHRRQVGRPGEDGELLRVQARGSLVACHRPPGGGHRQASRTGFHDDARRHFRSSVRSHETTRPHTGQRCERDSDGEPADQPPQAEGSRESMPDQSRHPDESNSPDESNDGWGVDGWRRTGSDGGGGGGSRRCGGGGRRRGCGGRRGGLGRRADRRRRGGRHWCRADRLRRGRASWRAAPAAGGADAAQAADRAARPLGGAPRFGSRSGAWRRRCAVSWRAAAQPWSSRARSRTPRRMRL